MRFKKNLQLIVTCFLSSTILFKVILVQFSAIALEFNDRNNITLNAENKIASDNRLSKSENLDASKNKIILIQSLKKADSNLQKNKQLSKLIPIELIAENHANLSDRSLLNSDRGDSPESKAQFKETLKDANSDLQKTKRLSEFTRANVIPIEVIAANNANLSDRSLLNTDKGDSPESKAQFKETLKDANSDLQKTKRLSEFT
ncbi:MAG: hypothetical protein V7K94_29175, partial [Nostoc sp.]